MKITKLGDVTIKNQIIKWSNENEEFEYIDLTSVDRHHYDIKNTTTISAGSAPSRAQKIVKSGDVLFGTTRPTLDRRCIVSTQYDSQICSTGLCVLRADDAKILPKYIFHLLSTPAFKQYVEENQRGTSYPAVTDKDVKNFEFNLPSLEEQQRVVTQLNAAFDKINRAIELTQQNLVNSEMYPSLWLNKVFTEKSTNWEDKKLFELVDFKGGGTPSKANPEYWTGSLPWVSPKDMKLSRISDSIDHISEKAVRESSTMIIPKDSILLVVRSGILAHTIPLAINTVDVTLNQDMKAMVPKEEIETETLYSILLALREIIFSFVSKGATVHRINFDQLKNLEISFPPERDKQIDFAEDCKHIINRSQELEELYKSKINALKSLKQSMLEQAFNAKVEA